MGKYTDNLFKRNRVRERVLPKRESPVELVVDDEETTPQQRRLVGCYIRRGGAVHSGFKSHYHIRAFLGHTDPLKEKEDDECGFVDSEGNLLSRREAMKVGAAAGQCEMVGRKLLSSDIDW